LASESVDRQAQGPRIIVQKFGGTSIATGEGQAQLARHVAEALAGGWSPVVVVSAMGRAGAPYATDTLLGLVAECGQHGEHNNARDRDLLLSCGEVISAVVAADVLRKAGYDALALTGQQAGIITDDAHGAASIVELRPERVSRHLARGQIVVVAGFQGATRSGEVTTLGRGGSDITAVALGAALDAGLVEVYTDVDGIKTADPRLVPSARTITHISYDETSQMAHEGAKVLHPRAADMAARFRLPVRIRSTFADSPGTLITTDGPKDPWSALAETGPVAGVTHVDSITLVSFGTEAGDKPPYKRTFQALAAEGINIDMISVTPQACSFIIASQVAQAADQALRGAGVRAALRSGLAKVSVVGRGMPYTPGVMARVSEALLDSGVAILQTSDSLMTISCLVDVADLETAVQALHSKFGLDQGDGN